MNPDLPTLNSVAENQQNSFMLKTLTPQIEIKQVDRPRYDVPIMIEITEQDVDQACHFTSCKRCLIATALKRMGHNEVSVDPCSVSFYKNGKWVAEYNGNLTARELGWDAFNDKWTKAALGKQIILYPANT